MHMVSMQCGWGFLYAQSMADGAIPYKDFYYAGTPLTLFIASFLYQIFGNELWSVVFLGSILRIAGYFLFYLLLLKIYKPFHAACGTLLCGVMYIAWIFVGPELSMNDISFLCGYGIPLIMISMLHHMKNNKRVCVYTCIVGVLCGISFINKQTFGITSILTSTILLVVIFIKEKKSIKLQFIYLFIYLLSISIVVLFPLIYLIYTDSYSYFIKDVFFNAAQAKSNLRTIIFFIFTSLGSPSYMKGLFLFVMGIIVIYVYTKYKKPVLHIQIQTKAICFLPCFYMFLVITAILVSYYFIQIPSVNKFRTMLYVANASYKIGAVAQFFIIIAAWYAFCEFLFGPINIEKEKKAIIYSFIFTLAYGCQVSLGMPNIPFFNYGILVSFLLNWNSAFYRIKNISIYLFVMVCVFAVSAVKMGTPCYWNSWASGSVVGNLQHSSLPALKYFTLPRSEVVAFEEITSIVNKYTEPEDRIFIYNNLPTFYVLLNRRPLTSNFSHYWDICTDADAKYDAEIIKFYPPKFILYLKYPLSIVAWQESLFRSGQPSGQREIDNSIATLLAHDMYKITNIYTSENENEIYAEAKPHDEGVLIYEDKKVVTPLSSILSGYGLYVLVRSDILEVI